MDAAQVHRLEHESEKWGASEWAVSWALRLETAWGHALQSPKVVALVLPLGFGLGRETAAKQAGASVLGLGGELAKNSVVDSEVALVRGLDFPEVRALATAGGCQLELDSAAEWD